MPGGNQLSAIQHVVVLMLENRSFDHMLGFLYSDQGNKSPAGQPFEGLTGTESNPDGSGAPVTVFEIKATDANAYFMPGADPGEGYAATNSELFGNATAPTPPVATNQGFVNDFAYTLTWQAQKKWSILPGTVAQNIMGIFTPEMLPVLSGLARGYAVCDHWYSPAPTETLPNRAFAAAGTSQGHMNDNTKSFTVPSIFGLMSQHDLDWAIYGYDSEPLTRLNFPDTTAAPATHFGLFKDFQAAAAAGTLPAYTFLEPDWGTTGNSQHPNYNVALGEQLIHDVYYALLNGKGWNQTLLIVTYDEHGGCYDHVPPPSGATPPDDTPGEYGFDFKRFGVRVPAVLVSPLIAPGIVFRVPQGTTPLDHTSILKTVEKRWGLPALTARDAAAPDVGDVLTLTTPRTDDPLKGVTVPTASGIDPAQGKPSHLQQVHADLASQLPVRDKEGSAHPSETPTLRTGDDYKAYIRSRTAAWNAHRQSTAADDGQNTKKSTKKGTKKSTKSEKKSAKKSTKKDTKKSAKKDAKKSAVKKTAAKQKATAKSKSKSAAKSKTGAKARSKSGSKSKRRS
jgi:phospholipase C